MGGYFDTIDRFAMSLTRWVIRYRWLVLLLALAAAFLAGQGATKLAFSSNYRAFFSKANPELQAFEELQATYTKNDNFLFVLEPDDGEVFNADVLAAVKTLTAEAWKIPYAIRVDSISNFQYTYGLEDDLIVEDLIGDIDQFSTDDFAQKKQIAVNEPLLKNQLITADAKATAINVVLQYPEESLSEIPEAVDVAKALRERIETEHPNIDISLTGVSMLNHAFADAGFSDVMTLVPVMFLVILALTWIILRTFSGTVATVSVILLSTVVAMGLAGFFGIEITPIAASAPVIILTLAIADSIHILVSLRHSMEEGMNKTEALVESIRINFMPVTITSLTTVVGFLSLNFSDAPPFWYLGNITAMGITAAWLYSLILLPAIMAILPYQVKRLEGQPFSTRMMDQLADWVLARRNVLLVSFSIAVLVLIALIPKIEFNDQWIEYFDKRIEFRIDSDKALKRFGMYPIEFSVGAVEAGGISEPEYLAHLQAFTDFLRQQDYVVHVYSIVDIMKRLNKNLHADDESYYKIPQSRELAAQYLLLYELSLPYGLDLNDRINVDKSATRVTATMTSATSAQTRAFLEKVKAWQRDNLPAYMHTTPTSPNVMFTYITERNVNNMILGTIFAILAIAVIMMLSLRSFKLGALSLIPNALPILAAFGAWAVIVGEVGFSVATVASISLGIIVDDTVHLLSKYVRARQERQLSIEDSIRYAFRNVGMAITINTIVLAIGFAVLTSSSFKVNVDMGLLTAIAIVFALILDFFFLPGLLLMGSKKQTADMPKTAHTA